MNTKLILMFTMFFLSILIVSAGTEYKPVNQEVNLILTCTIDNAIPTSFATMSLTVSYPNGSLFLDNVNATPIGNGIFNYTTTFPEIGTYRPTLACVDGLDSNSDSSGIYEVTPTGNHIDNDGQISIGILYFYVILGLGFLFLGFLFLKHESLWVTYFGLFIMILGFTFLYYDLHLSNLYATTIAINSGAGATATGAFMMIARFLKLAPYVVGGIVAFFSVKTLKEAIGHRNKNDGWDNNSYSN